MKILNVFAEKPGQSESGIYFNELAKQFAQMGHEQAIVAGITAQDKAEYVAYYKQLSDSDKAPVSFYPVLFETSVLPFPIVSMSEDLPYKTTRYASLDEDTAVQFQNAFCFQIGRAIEEFEPDFILCHDFYLLAATICNMFLDQHVVGICRDADLKQIEELPLAKDYIEKSLSRIDRVFVSGQEQYDKVIALYPLNPNKVQIAPKDLAEMVLQNYR